MRLGAADYYTVSLLLHNPQEHVLVNLFVRGERPVAFHVCHACIAREVILLHVLQEFHEPRIILGLIFLVNVIGDDGKGRKAVKARAPLVACADIVGNLPVYLDPRYEIFNARRRKGETAYRLVDQRAVRNDQIRVELGHFIGGPGCFYTCAKARIIDNIREPLSKHIGYRIEGPQ